MAELQKCKDDLKHCYRERINQKQSTRWSTLLGDPTLYVDVTIVRAKRLSKRFREEHAMGLADRGDHSYVTVYELLKDGHGKVVLIEGDPGAGKTTFTFHICKEWSEDKLLTEDIVFWIPLRHYKSVTTTSELFDKLGYPEMMEYVQQRSGKGFVLILDGWDELPNQLQTASLFRDIIFGRIRTFFQSTIIVTSRSSCSSEIAVAVEETNSYYQILGFDQERAVTYINDYFHNKSSSAELLTFLNSNEYLYRDFYIPISVAIMCFVYHSDSKQTPQTLLRLYERFVVLCLRSNIPNPSPQDLAKFKTIYDIPDTIRHAFQKLCKKALDMLKDNKLVLNEDEEMDNLQLKQFHGFGLLHIDHYTNTLATIETSYSFIHRAVQELLAAIFILDTGNISDIKYFLDEYFYVGSYLMNVFPFLFALMSKEQKLLRPLAGKLKQIYNKYAGDDKLLSSILYCLFEAHDETLCHEFSQVFSKKRDVNLFLRAFLECHYYYYFLSVCEVKELNVSITHKFALQATDDVCFEVMAKYLSKPSTDISSFTCIINALSETGMKQFVSVLANQKNLCTVKVECNSCPPGCIKILCDSICKHNQITSLILPKSVLNTGDLESIGSVIATPALSLEKLHLTSYSPDDGDSFDTICKSSLPVSIPFCKQNLVKARPTSCLTDAKKYLNLSGSFCTALCKTTLLQKLWLSRLNLSQADSKVFGKIISQNCSLKELYINVATADCLDPILNGLSSNTSITTFRGWPSKAGASNDALGQCLEKCLTLNHSLNMVDFTASSFREPSLYVSWLSTQVCSICTGLCANTTVVTLDISGCYIDTEACHAVCGVLSQNTTLQRLFLNPVKLEKQEAITMIESCRDNDTLELLSLVQWPPRLLVSGEGPFEFSCDPELQHVLQETQALQRESSKSPLLKVYWLVNAACSYVLLLIVNVL